MYDQKVHQFWSSTSFLEALTSAATISVTSSSNVTLRFQPRIRSALAGFPRRRLECGVWVSWKKKGRGDNALDFGGTEVVGVHLNDNAAGFNVYSLFVNAMASPSNSLDQGR